MIDILIIIALAAFIIFGIRYAVMPLFKMEPSNIKLDLTSKTSKLSKSIEKTTSDLDNEIKKLNKKKLSSDVARIRFWAALSHYRPDLFDKLVLTDHDGALWAVHKYYFGNGWTDDDNDIMELVDKVIKELQKPRTINGN